MSDILTMKREVKEDFCREAKSHRERGELEAAAEFDRMAARLDGASDDVIFALNLTRVVGDAIRLMIATGATTSQIANTLRDAADSIER